VRFKVISTTVTISNISVSGIISGTFSTAMQLNTDAYNVMLGLSVLAS